jgi:uncharacterized membrane protein YphA (DoxX/SURF4 family)
MTDPVIARNLPPGVLRRFGLRFFAVYQLLYSVVPFLGRIPGGWHVVARFYQLWEALVPWTERRILGMAKPIPYQPTGSGDTTFDWIVNGWQLALALAVATLWSAFDRKRRWDVGVAEILRACVRIILACTLLGYGFSKLIPPLQFPAPWAGRFLEQLGQFSPMGLLWTFMGASRVYTAFSGLIEVIGGLLLLWRRTTPMGALVAAGVMLNVVLLNFCYDVPVKLYSTNLLVMALFLLWPDVRRLTGVLILNRPTEAANLAQPWTSRWFKLASSGLKTLVIVSIVLDLVQYRTFKADDADLEPAPAESASWTGVWNVEHFSLDGAELKPLMTDEKRWRRVIFERPPGGLRIYVFGAEHLIGGWYVSPGSGKGKLMVRTNAKDAAPQSIRYVVRGPDRLQLMGKFDGHPFDADLRRAGAREMLLVNRGFHWVNETPFNR